MVETTIGGKPADLTKVGGGLKVVFHPMAKNAKHPRANVFQVVLSKSDLEVLKKAL